MSSHYRAVGRFEQLRTRAQVLCIADVVSRHFDVSIFKLMKYRRKGGRTQTLCANVPIRSIVWYLAVTAFDARQVAVAKVSGRTKQTICEAVRAVEALRDDPCHDALIGDLEQKLQVYGAQVLGMGIAA